MHRHDRATAGPVHQGRSAHQHHDQLPARGVSRASSRGCRTRCRRAPTPTSSGACARSSASAPRELFAEFDERRSPRRRSARCTARALPTGERWRSRCSTPTSRRSSRIDLRALRRIFGVIAWFVPYHGPRAASTARSARWCCRSSTSAARPTTSSASPPTSPAAPTSAFPKVRRELLDGARAHDRVDRRRQGRATARGSTRSASTAAQLARAVVDAYCQQIFTDGVYHADPHPGNMLVRRTRRRATSTHRVHRLRRGGRGVADDARAASSISSRARIARDTPRIVARDEGRWASSPRGADPAIFDRVIEYFHEKFQEEMQLETLLAEGHEVRSAEGRWRTSRTCGRMDVSLRDLRGPLPRPEGVDPPRADGAAADGAVHRARSDAEPDGRSSGRTSRSSSLGKDRDWSAFVVDTTQGRGAHGVALPAR